MTCTFPNCDCVRDNLPLCKKSSIHAIYPTKAGFGATQRLYTEAELQAAIAAAMMGAVKPLEWEEDVDYRGNRIWKAVSPITGEKYWSLDGAGYREYQDKEHAARILSALSIPTDAGVALEAALMGAYKEGWSDGAANYHHDRNETPDDGWLISDTYLDTAAMSQEK